MTADFDFYINIENQAGQLLGDGPITSAAQWRYTARMDRAGEFSFTTPATDAKATLIQRKRVARAFALLDGTWTEVGAGVIDKIEKRPDANGITELTVSGPDLLGELLNRSVLNLRIYLDNAPISHSAAVNAIAAFAPPGWSFTSDSAPPNNLLYGRFNGQTVLAALIKIGEKSQNHFYRGTGRTVVFGSTFTPSNVRAIRADGDLAPETCAITAISEQIDTHDLITRIYPRGSGNADVQLTLRATTRTAPTGFILNKSENYIENVAAAAAYGRIERQIDFREIGPVENTTADLVAAANMLFDAALEELRRRSNELEQATYTLALAQCSQLLRPLQSIVVDYRDPDAGLIVNQALNILEATWEVDTSGARTTALVVSNADRWPASDVGTVVDVVEQGQLYQALPQLNANSYTTGYTKHVDATEVASIRFRFGREVVQLQQVLFEFQLLPFESTVKSVGGVSGTSSEAASSLGSSSTVTDHSHTVTVSGHSHTVTITGHSHTVTISGHNHTVTISAHNHTVTVSGHSHTVTITGHSHTVTISGHNHTVTVPAHQHTVTVPSHDHSVTIPSHQHGVPNHQHTLNLAKSGGGFTVRAALAGSLALLQYDGGGGDPDTVGARTTPDSGATTSESGGGSTQSSSTADSTQDTSSTADSTQDTSSTTSQQTPTTSTTSQQTPTSSTTSDQTPTSSTLAQQTPTTSTTSQQTPTSSTTSDQTPTSSTTSQQTPTSSSGGSHAHTVTIPAHNHTVLPILSTIYGIFRESLGNTYGIDDLEYRVNAGGWTALSAATDIGGNWRRLDITNQVMDADTFRPVQENNTVEIRVGDGAWIEITNISSSFGALTILTDPPPVGDEVGKSISVRGTTAYDGTYKITAIGMFLGSPISYVCGDALASGGTEHTGEATIHKTVTVDILLSVRNVIQSVALT